MAIQHNGLAHSLYHAISGSNPTINKKSDGAHSNEKSKREKKGPKDKIIAAQFAKHGSYDKKTRVEILNDPCMFILLSSKNHSKMCDGKIIVSTFLNKK